MNQERELINEDDIDFMTVDDLIEDEVEETHDPDARGKASRHYVNNKDLHEEFCKWIPLCREAKEKGEPNPQVPHEIAVAIMKICQRRSFHHWYINYTDNWKADMVGDAIEICIRYCHNYNPEKTKNPFSYITTFCRNAFEQRLEKERRQVYYQSKLVAENSGFFAELDENVESHQIDGINLAEENPIMANWRENIETFESHQKRKRLKSKLRKEKSTLAKMIDKPISEEE